MIYYISNSISFDRIHSLETMTLIDDECEEVRTSKKINVIRGALIREKKNIFFFWKETFNK